MSQKDFQHLFAAVEARKISFADSLARADAIMGKLCFYATPPLPANGPHSLMQPDQRYDTLARQQPETVNPNMLMLDRGGAFQRGAHARLHSPFHWSCTPSSRILVGPFQLE